MFGAYNEDKGRYKKTQNGKNPETARDGNDPTPSLLGSAIMEMWKSTEMKLWNLLDLLGRQYFFLLNRHNLPHI